MVVLAILQHPSSCVWFCQHFGDGETEAPRSPGSESPGRGGIQAQGCLTARPTCCSLSPRFVHTSSPPCLTTMASLLDRRCRGPGWVCLTQMIRYAITATARGDRKPTVRGPFGHHLLGGLVAAQRPRVCLFCNPSLSAEVIGMASSRG